MLLHAVVCLFVVGEIDCRSLIMALVLFVVLCVGCCWLLLVVVARCSVLPCAAVCCCYVVRYVLLSAGVWCLCVVVGAAAVECLLSLCVCFVVVVVWSVLCVV